MQGPDLTVTTLAIAADSVLNGPVVVRIAGDRESTKAVRMAALRLEEPSRVVMTERGGRGSRAELCLGERCLSGLTSAEDLTRALRELRFPPGEATGAAPGEPASPQ